MSSERIEKVIFLLARSILNKRDLFQRSIKNIFPKHKKLASHHNIARYLKKTEVNDNFADEKPFVSENQIRKVITEKMAKKFLKRFSRVAMLLALAVSMLFGTDAYAAGACSPSVSCFSAEGTGFSSATVACSGIGTGTSRVSVSSERYRGTKLYAGGIPFGVKFMTDGVLVIGFAEIKTEKGTEIPAKDAGFQLGDVILKIGSSQISSSADVCAAVEKSGGKALDITYRRDGKEMRTMLRPAYSTAEGKYKSGIYVRDSGAGIGTVTYIMPETLEFGGLGHGICDGDTGKLIPMQRGSVVGVTINGVVKGVVGTPGEVKGYFSSGKSGSLFKNTEHGVFGAYAAMPKNCGLTLYEVGLRNELKCGKAQIICTLDEGGAQSYDVEISEIRLSSTSNKCFNVKVTDPDLLTKTGGIVQGMSGSPIIQNGKLVGAVTHVLINDPTTGYGIFIENMLGAAQMPMAKAS